MASFLDMFSVALMPVLKVLLMTAAGLFLALDSVDLLGDTSRHHLNRIVFYCFNPALVAVSFAKTVTFQSFITLWFMPVNIFLTYLIGTVLGWVLGKVIKAPNHIKCLMLASCASGNFLALPIIIIPAMCQLKGGPFGTPNVCAPHGLVYASLSMAIGVTYFWSYTYNMVRIYPKDTVPESLDVVDSSRTVEGKAEETVVNVKDLELLSRMNSTLVTPVDELSDSSSNKGDEETPANDAECVPSAHESKELSGPSTFMIALACVLKRCLRDASKKMNLKKTMAPSTIAGIVGILIGMIYPIKYVLIGDSAPLRVISNTSSMIGDAAIPCTALILGANLLKGLRGCKVQHTVIIGIIAVRYILLPLIGILIVKGAVHLGFVEAHNPLLHFSLMLHFALPPAMNLGTVTQLFGIGQRECSVIMLWTYAVAAVAVTLWCTLFSWLVAF